MSDAKKILIVDDDKYILRSLEKLLQRVGYSIQTAATAAKGLQVMQEFKPDLLILDIQLPDMSGVGVLNELSGKTGQAHVPVLVLTGRPHMENFFKEMSHVRVAQKPYTTADLLALIGEMVQGSKKSAPTPAATSPVRPFKVLVVEDDEAVLSSLLLTLRQAGIAVEPFRRGSGALDQIVRMRPEVVLMNRILPRMNGETLAAALWRTPDTQGTAIVMYDLSGMTRTMGSLKDRCPNVVAYLTSIEATVVIDAVTKAGAAKIPVPV